ncbi:MAG: hypothetical protein RLZZ211_543 [Bacteroidota bacterium]|jgi:hypothetical protein
MNLTEAQIAHLILAFHEGTLSNAEKAQLDALVQENSAFAFDLEAFPTLISPSIQIDSTAFTHPLLEDLAIYKNEEGHPLEKLIVGSLEGTLNAQEQKVVQAYAADAHYQKLQKQFAHTKLLPDQAIHYPDVDKLLKNAPIRSLNWKHYATITSSAAAVLLAVFLIGQANTHQDPIQGKAKQQARVVPTKKSTQVQSITIQRSPVEPHHIDQVAIHPHVIGEPPRDCIVPIIYPIHEVQPEIQIAQLSSPNAALPEETTPAQMSSMNLAQSNLSAFQKEPITMKAFLLQKTNEKLFGTAAPTTDLKFETLARYASESVGIPVRYQVEEAAPHQDKLVFQLGPITIEKTRSRK